MGDANCRHAPDIHVAADRQKNLFIRYHKSSCLEEYKSPLANQRAFFVLNRPAGPAHRGLKTPEGVTSGGDDRISRAAKTLGKIGDAHVLRLGTGSSGKSEQKAVKFGIVQCVELKRLYQIRWTHLVNNAGVLEKEIICAIERIAGRIVTLLHPQAQLKIAFSAHLCRAINFQAHGPGAFGAGAV